MNILSINTALKTNSVPAEYLSQHKLFVFVEKSEINKLAQHIVYGAESIICYNSVADILPLTNELGLSAKDTRVFCVSEDYMVSAAEVRASMGLQGLKPEFAERFRDKTIMKEQLKNIGLRVPHFGHFDKSMSFGEVKDKVGIPFVLKPIDALGALGVYIIHSELSYSTALEQMGNERYEFEEYISGTLYHIDTLLQSGDVKFQVVCEYTAPNLDFQKGTPIISVPLLDNDELAINLKEFTISCLNALGLQSGPAHTEVFVLNSGELVFLESAARTPGAVIVPLYEKQFGFNMIEAALKIELDMVFKLSKRDSTTHYFSGIFPTSQGVLTKKLSLAIDSKYAISWKVDEGDMMTKPMSLRDISASVVAENECYNSLKNDFRALIELTPYELQH